MEEIDTLGEYLIAALEQHIKDYTGGGIQRIPNTVGVVFVATTTGEIVQVDIHPLTLTRK